MANKKVTMTIFIIHVCSDRQPDQVLRKLCYLPKQSTIFFQMKYFIPSNTQS